MKRWILKVWAYPATEMEGAPPFIRDYFWTLVGARIREERILALTPKHPYRTQIVREDREEL